jgi:hypothetical protein
VATTQIPIRPLEVLERVPAVEAEDLVGTGELVAQAAQHPLGADDVVAQGVEPEHGGDRAPAERKWATVLTGGVGGGCRGRGCRLRGGDDPDPHSATGDRAEDAVGA